MPASGQYSAPTQPVHETIRFDGEGKKTKSHTWINARFAFDELGLGEELEARNAILAAIFHQVVEHCKL
jgi:hypothetical protein